MIALPVLALLAVLIAVKATEFSRPIVDNKKAEANFYNYNGTVIEDKVGDETKGSWVMYKQCDSRWANQQLGYCSQTICSAGCAMTSVAMMLKTKGANYDPSTLDHWLTVNGGYANGCDIYWGSVDAFGVTKFQGIETASESEICSGLSAMHGIIANVNGGGHWVLLTGCKGNGVFTVNDPGYSKTTYTMGEILREAVYH